MVRITSVDTGAYTIPTEEPETDGTLRWISTTMVTARVQGGGATGFGYAYGHAAAAEVAGGTLGEVLKGEDAMGIERLWWAMLVRLRNVGRHGIGATAVSVLDVALWDLKARILGLPLAEVIGRAADRVPVYGSGGFCNYSSGRLAEQLGGWAGAGFPAVKMKVGRDPDADPDRVAAARRALGPEPALMVDANGAYSRKQAIELARRFCGQGVSWFEEPVSSDDREGLRLVRDRAPAGMEIASGEYAYDPWEFQKLLDAKAVDVLQADATRCGGVTGFLKAAALAEACHIDISSHTAPQLHARIAPCVSRFRHLEWFHDHVRLERMVLDGFVEPEGGRIGPERGVPGLGLTPRSADLEPYAA